MHLGLQYQALGVHQQLSLPAANLLTAVVSSRLSAHPARLCGLRVHYPGTGLGISPEPSAQELADSVVHSFSQTVSKGFLVDLPLREDGTGIPYSRNTPRKDGS